MNMLLLIAALIAQGGSRHSAPKVAQAVMHYATLRKLPVDLVVGVIGVENPELNPAAKNPDGSLGIMQVQPLWIGAFKECGRDLTDASTNICVGTAVLALNIQETKTIRAALLRYNGCRSVRCAGYADRVLAHAAQARGTP